MFKTLFKSIAIRSGRKELEKLLNGLKGANDREIAMTLAITHMHRVNMQDSGLSILEILNGMPISTHDNVQICTVLRQMILDCQSVQRQDLAVGLMVWLHSIRAADMIEMRYLARQMWQELSRGINLAKEQFDALDDLGLLSLTQDISGNEIDFTLMPEMYD